MSTEATTTEKKSSTFRRKIRFVFSFFLFMFLLAGAGYVTVYHTDILSSYSTVSKKRPPSQNDIILATLQRQLNTLEQLTRTLQKKNQQLEARLHTLQMQPPPPPQPFADLSQTTTPDTPASTTTLDEKITPSEEDTISLEQQPEKQPASQDTSQLIVSALNLREAILHSRSFEYELEKINHANHDSPFIQEHIAQLAKYAPFGVLNTEALEKDFNDVTNRILKLSREIDTSPSLLNKAAAHLSHVITIRKIDGDAQSNQAVDIIARAEKYLKYHQLQPAIDELNHLEINLRSLAQPWIEKAQASLESQRSSKAILDHAINISQASM